MRRGRLSPPSPNANPNGQPKAEPDLAASLGSTLRGLQTLLRSLEGSGFADSIGPYREMQVVLLQQRLWSRSNGRADLDPTWAEIAETARSIDEILSGFAAVMAELGQLDRVEPAPDGRPARLPGSLEPELAAALVGPSVSAARLAAALPWPDELRRRRLSELVAAGVLERRGWGRGLSYRPSAAMRTRLADALGDSR
jgi:hypothetical protein